MAGVQGRVALVTGAGSENGIGFAIARVLAAAGARVALTATTDRILDRQSAIPGSFAATADLTDEAQVAGLVAAVTEALGPVSILVNNAGMAQTGIDLPRRRLADTPPDTWRYLTDISLTSAYLVTRACLPGMVAARHGRIIHMSSVTGPLTGIDGSAAYATAKAGLLGMARVLALEYGSTGITANCIAPGWIESASSSEAEITAGRHTPVGRSGTPAEVAHAALFLAADEASYVTGQMIVVDGGNTIQEYKISL
jgi:3-oxoacyl-[acyl-carrier protein] reductase